MNVMEATFSGIEGLGFFDSLSMSIGPQNITLATNGKVVWVEERVQPKNSLALTPKGWHRLAQCAERLLNDANEAWNSLSEFDSAEG